MWLLSFVYLALFVLMGVLGIRKGRRLHQQWGASKRSNYPWVGVLGRKQVTGKQMVFVGVFLIVLGVIGFSFLIDAPGWLRARLSPCHQAVDVSALSDVLGLSVDAVRVSADEDRCTAMYFVDDGGTEHVLTVRMPVSTVWGKPAAGSVPWDQRLIECEAQFGVLVSYHGDFLTAENVESLLAGGEDLCRALSEDSGSP